MNNQYFGDPRFTDEVTKRMPHGYRPLRKTRAGLARRIPASSVDGGSPTEVAQPELPLIHRMSESAAERKSEGNRQRGRAGSADPSQVIVTAGATAHSVQVHHHGIPELQSHGESPESATVNLAQDLAREIDGAADDLHREPLERRLTMSRPPSRESLDRPILVHDDPRGVTPSG